MEKLMVFFPLSRAVAPGNGKQFVVALLIYLVAIAVVQVLRAIVGWIPLVGRLLAAVMDLVGIYCVVGLELAIVKFCGK